MRIGINALGPISTDTGGRTYLINMVRAWQSLGLGHQFVVFVSPHQSQILDIKEPNFETVEVPFSSGSSVRRALAEHGLLPFYVRRAGVDVMYFPSNFASIHCPVPYALAIRSMLIYNFPATSSIGKTKGFYRKTLLPLSSRRANIVITPSHHTRREIEQHLHVDRFKIRVVPHGLDTALFQSRGRKEDAESTLRRHRVTTPFILYVSALWDYKNHDRLILAFEKLKKNWHIPHRLVLIGRGMNSYESYFSHLKNVVRNSGVTDEVVFIDSLVHEELRYVYQEADLFVFPSLIESFGNSLFEAMAAGTPVVCSDRHGLPELVGDAALLVNPLDVGGLAEAMQRVLSDTTLRNLLVHRGRAHVSRFSWTHCASETLSAIQEALV